MARTITYICDSCKGEWTNDSNRKNMMTISIIVSTKNDTGVFKENGSNTSVKSVLWCRTCAIKHGLIPPITYNDDLIAPKPKDFSEQIIALTKTNTRDQLMTSQSDVEFRKSSSEPTLQLLHDEIKKTYGSRYYFEQLDPV